MKEVSASAQRVPRPSTSHLASASFDMPAAMPCSPSRMFFAPVRPSAVMYAASRPSAAALAVCNCLESAASRRNSHKPAAWVPALPMQLRNCSVSKSSSLATVTAAARVPTVAVVWKMR
ncbi:hypothetical protein D3C78_1324860 [compost metagenome]